MASYTKAFAATGQARAAPHLPPLGAQRYFVRESYGMPMANAALQLPELEDRLHDLLAMAENGRLATSPRSPLPQGAEVGRQEANAQCGDPRQPIDSYR